MHNNPLRRVFYYLEKTMAAKGLGTLTLDLIAKIGGFIGPMDQAARKAAKTGKIGRAHV